MTILAKELFAFASYNAGAGRISVMRKEAQGGDRRKGFRKSSSGGGKIGQETVTYVSNITSSTSPIALR